MRADAVLARRFATQLDPIRAARDRMATSSGRRSWLRVDRFEIPFRLHCVSHATPTLKRIKDDDNDSNCPDFCFYLAHLQGSLRR
jgi:hypothetical protein